MTTNIASKLDFLMKLTSTTNSVLGRVLSFDASYISRIRSGKRGMPKHQPFIEPASAFFARNLRQPFQQRAAAEVVCDGRPWPEREEEAAQLIANWLERDTDTDDPIASFLAGIAQKPAARTPSKVPQPQAPVGKAPLYTYGNDGKREAVLLFLEQLCACDTPPELMLYSDENMDWMVEDGAFALAWANFLQLFAEKGGSICMIHTVSRNSAEMFEGLSKWIPLYLTGHIEPYYCPGALTDIFRRSLFIAKGSRALVSNSVGAQTEGMLNLAIEDKRAVEALELEFARLLSHCRPLMRIFDASDTQQSRAAKRLFQRAQGEITLLQLNGPDAEESAVAFACGPDVGLVVRQMQPKRCFLLAEPQLGAALFAYLEQAPDAVTGRALALERLENLLGT